MSALEWEGMRHLMYNYNTPAIPGNCRVCPPETRKTGVKYIRGSGMWLCPDCWEEFGVIYEGNPNG